FHGVVREAGVECRASRQPAQDTSVAVRRSSLCQTPRLPGGLSPSIECGLVGLSPVMRPLADEPRWPAADGRRVVFLVDASSGLERRLLGGWVAGPRRRGVPRAGSAALPFPAPRGGGGGAVDPRLEASLAMGDDPLLAPLRAAWFPAERNGVRAARF